MRFKRLLGAAAAAALVFGGAQVPASAASAAPHAVTYTAAESAALAAQPDMPPVLDDNGKVLRPAQAGSVRGLDKVMTADHANFRDLKTGLKKNLNFYAPKAKPPVRKAGATTTSSAKTMVNGKVLTTTYYFHGGGWQYATTDGASVNLTTVKPYIQSGTVDYHSLMEQSAESADQQQAVEIGNMVSPNTNGDSDSHLFVFYWKNGVGTCYNICGFTAAAGVPASSLPGATLTPGTGPKYGIQFFDNVWWVNYNNQWIGYFPHTLWTNSPGSVTFNKQGLGQAFAELATTSPTPCGDMGTGVLGTPGSSTAAAISNWSVINPNPVVASAFAGFAVNPTGLTGKYEAALNSGSVRSGRAGGPGYNATGTGNGNTGSC